MILESLFISILFLLQPVLAQSQPSVVWDENTKSWVSVPNTATATPTPPPTTTTTTPPQQQQIPQTQIPPAPQIIQTVPTTPAGAPVDFGTLMTVVGPMFAALSAYILKKQKDDKEDKKKLEIEAKENDKKIREQTIDEIKAAIIPQLKPIIPVTEHTAKLDVKINQLAEAFYEFMGDAKANEIKDKPDIKKTNLVEDVVKSKIIAEQAKNGGSVVWDDVKKEWVSK